MNKELLQKAIEHISRPDVALGYASVFYNDGKPCCALGHMAAVAGLAPDALADDYEPIGDVYGVDIGTVDDIWRLNDQNPFDTTPEQRKVQILAYLKELLA